MVCSHLSISLASTFNSDTTCACCKARFSASFISLIDNIYAAYEMYQIQAGLSNNIRPVYKESFSANSTGWQITRGCLMTRRQDSSPSIRLSRNLESHLGQVVLGRHTSKPIVVEMFDAPFQSATMAAGLGKIRRNHLLSFAPIEVQLRITLPGFELSDFANIESSDTHAPHSAICH